jgi:hypothetical protein
MIGGDRHFARKFVALKHSSLSPFLCLTHGKAFRYFVGAVLLLLFSVPGYAQTFRVPMHCNEANQVDIGAVLVGDTLVDTLVLVNELENGDSAWTVEEETSEVFLSPAPPKLRFGDSIRTFIRYAPRFLEKLTLPIRLVADSSFCETYIIVTASGVGPTPNGSTLPLQHTSSDIIAIESNSDTAHRQFYLRNDSTTSIILDTMYVAGTSAFTIESRPSFPDTIPPLASIKVGIKFGRNSVGSDNGLLVSVPNHTTITDAIRMSLQGLRVEHLSSAERGPRSPEYISLYPNPSHGPISVHTEGLAHTQIEVVDILGISQREDRFEGNWMWDGLTSSEHRIMPGAYFVIVSGMNEQHELVREVRSLIVQ